MGEWVGWEDGQVGRMGGGEDGVDGRMGGMGGWVGVTGEWAGRVTFRNPSFAKVLGDLGCGIDMCHPFLSPAAAQGAALLMVVEKDRGCPTASDGACEGFWRRLLR